MQDQAALYAGLRKPMNLHQDYDWKRQQKRMPRESLSYEPWSQERKATRYSHDGLKARMGNCSSGTNIFKENL